MKPSARRWIIVGAAAAAAVGIWPLARDAATAVALVTQLARPLEPGALTRWTSSPRREDLMVPSAGRPLAATLFRPARSPRDTGVVLVHGVNPTGKDDPRIVWVADLLARAGFLVLAPDFTGLTSLTLRAGDVDEIASSAHFLNARMPGGGPRRVGLVAFSYGAGPALVAAADPTVRDLIRFVVSFGGYYDLANVITFVTTGWYEHGVHRGKLAPNPYDRWIFLKGNLELLDDPEDRRVLARMIGERAGAPPRENDPPPGLTPGGRAIYGLMGNRDPGRVPALLAHLPPGITGQIARLSPSRIVGDLRAHLFIVHSNPDPFIPFTESLRLAEAAPDPSRVHLAILGSFRHVQPQFPPLTWRTFWDFYLEEGWRIFRLVYRLLRVGA